MLKALLEEKEITAIERFADRLTKGLGKRVLDVRLFGSKARGDFAPDSDLDIFIVLDNSDWSAKDQIRFIAADISLEYDVLLNTHILSRQRWEELAYHRATLWCELERDGVSLMPPLEQENPAN
jgi:predicted nucleotidyltransferase